MNRTLVAQAALGPGPRAASRLDGPCAWAAWLLPLIFGIGSTGGSPTWSDDLAVVRDLGGVPLGSEGVLSSLFSQLLSLLPVGGRALRASLLGVVAFSACSRLLFGQLRALLDTQQPLGASPLLALIGSQLWALHPSALGEAARVGGAALPLLILLLGARLLSHLRSDARVFPLMGALIAVSAAESHAAGMILLLAFSVHSLCQRPRVTPGMWLGGFGSLLLGSVLCGAWRGLRPWSPGVELDLGVLTPAGLGDPAPLGGVVALAESVGQLWLERLGTVPLVLALLGVSWVLRRGGVLRREVVVWGVFVAVGALVPVVQRMGKPVWVSLGALVSSLGLAAFVTLALYAGVGWLWTCRLPFARPASVLSVSFSISLVLGHIDELTVADVAPSAGAELWTEEALGKLPPRSVLLLRDPDLLFRLLAARVLGGERPDVLIVHGALLGSSSWVERLVATEPELAPLLRQLTIHGRADEYSLSRLADARPVFVELERSWDRRLIGHLRPEAMWLGFSAHPLGVSDREVGMTRSRAALQRVLRDLEAQPGRDAVTLRVLADLAAQQATALAALGDREGTRRLLRVVRRLEPADRAAAGLEARLARAERGPIAIFDLTD